MVSYPRFTPAERRKLTMSARARESFRAVGIRGGAGPGEGAPSAPPGTYNYYDLSEDDRALIETVIADNQSDDLVKRKEALKWWSDAIMNLSGPDPYLIGQALTGESLGSLILDFFGMHVLQPFELSGEGVYASNLGWAAALTSLTVSEPAADNKIQVSFGVAFSILDWACVNQTLGEQETTLYSSQSIGIIIEDSEGGIGLSDSGGSIMRVDGFRAPGCAFPGYDPGDRIGEAFWKNSGSGTVVLDGTELCVTARIFDADHGTLATSDEICNGQSFNNIPELGAPEPTGVPPAGTPTVPIDPCDLVPLLRDYPYAPPPGTPPGTPPGGTPPDGNPVDPDTGLPPGELPTQPPDPGVNPFPGQPATDVPPGTGDPGLPPGDPGLPPIPTVPPGPVVPGTDPIESGIEDPAAGGCMKLSGEPPGFRDPNQAGGIARKYQPGQPMVIDYGEGSRCKVKIVKVKPDPAVPEICVSGGIDNSGKITEKTCYGPGPVEDAIRSVLGDMVAEGGNIIFDSDCARELHRPLCFRAGTLKRVILNTLLDLCGFCVFPMFDCNVIVGYCGPTGVKWTYHEDVDLIKFDLEYDGQEVFDYVEVFRGDFISRAGNVFVRGNSVLYPVGSPASSVNGDRVYQYEVSYGTPDSELNSIAVTLAAKLRSQALPEIAFGVPLNSQMTVRHQLRIQMPSVGFDAYYMVTRLARDYDRENGHLSTGLARWLRAA